MLQGERVCLAGLTAHRTERAGSGEAKGNRLQQAQGPLKEGGCLSSPICEHGLWEF